MPWTAGRRLTAGCGSPGGQLRAARRRQPQGFPHWPGRHISSGTGGTVSVWLRPGRSRTGWGVVQPWFLVLSRQNPTKLLLRNLKSASIRTAGNLVDAGMSGTCRYPGHSGHGGDTLGSGCRARRGTLAVGVYDRPDSDRRGCPANLKGREVDVTAPGDNGHATRLDARPVPLGVEKPRTCGALADDTMPCRREIAPGIVLRRARLARVRLLPSVQDRLRCRTEHRHNLKRSRRDPVLPTVPTPGAVGMVQAPGAPDPETRPLDFAHRMAWACGRSRVNEVATGPSTAVPGHAGRRPASALPLNVRKARGASVPNRTWPCTSGNGRGRLRVRFRCLRWCRLPWLRSCVFDVPGLAAVALGRVPVVDGLQAVAPPTLGLAVSLLAAGRSPGLCSCPRCPSRKARAARFVLVHRHGGCPPVRWPAGGCEWRRKADDRPWGDGKAPTPLKAPRADPAASVPDLGRVEPCVDPDPVIHAGPAGGDRPCGCRCLAPPCGLMAALSASRTASMSPGAWVRRCRSSLHPRSDGCRLLPVNPGSVLLLLQTLSRSLA